MKKRTLYWAILVAFLVCPLMAAEAQAWTLYVNDATGRDAPFRGFSPGKPLKTISYAVKHAYDNVTVRVAAGNYMESIAITRIVNLTLVGEGPATVISGDGSEPSIFVQGPSRVAIRGFTIEGGSYGILGRDNTTLDIQDVTVRDHIYNGIVTYQSSSATIDGCQVLNNGGNGVQILNSSVVLTNSTIDGNQGYGIKLLTSSHAHIGLALGITPAGNIITANGLDGIGVFNGATAYFFDNTIGNNQRHGINISRATARLMGRNVIEQNVWHGMRVGNGSSVFQGQGDLPISGNLDTIRNNSRHGIYAGNNTSLRIHEMDINTNKRHGIFLDFHSTLYILNSTIAANDGFGILMARDAGLYLENSVDISGHGTGIECLDGESSYSGETGGVSDPIGLQCTGYSP